MSKFDYNNTLLQNAVSQSRSLNISEVCRDLRISRQTFYNVIDKDTYVSEEMVVAVARKLGFTREQILTAPSFAQSVP